MQNLWLRALLECFLRFGWRATRAVHAVPYWIGAALFGWVAIWLWGSPFPPMVGAALCSGGVVVCTCWDWFREWRRG